MTNVHFHWQLSNISADISISHYIFLRSIPVSVEHSVDIWNSASMLPLLDAIPQLRVQRHAYFI